MADGKTVTVKIEAVSSGASGAKKFTGDLEKEVAASQKRIEQNTRKTDAAITASAKATASAQIRENKQIANEFLKNLKQMEAGAKQSATSIRGILSGSFGGGLVGGFAGSLFGSVTSQLAQLPTFLKTQLDEMVRIAAERTNALKGLESVALFKGISGQATSEAVQNLRLVKAGVVDLAEASTSLKNLLATGFTLPQAVKLLERFSDSAAFGKQAALGFGEAIRSATEGLKNGNSILVDNAGVTKNLSVILEEHGKKKTDVMNITSDASVREAVYAGLIKETTAQIGDADKLTKGWTGTTAALKTAQDNLYAAIGNIITRSPELIAAIQSVTSDTADLTKAMANADSQGSQTVESLTAKFARFSVDFRAGINSEIADLQELTKAVEVGANAIAYAFWTGLNTVPMAVNRLVIDPLNQLARKMNELGAWNAAGMIGGGNIPQISILDTPINSTYGNMTNARNQMGTYYAGAQHSNNALNNSYLQNLKNGRTSPTFSGGLSNPFGLPNNVAFPGGASPGTAGHAGGAPEPAGKGKGKGRGSGAAEHQISPAAKSIIAAADRIGLSPLDYATLLLYEGAGSLSTSTMGGKGGKYMGPMQMGPWEQGHYGIKKGMSLDAYLGKANQYLTDRGVKPGDDLLTMYKAVNGGNVNVSGNASDGNGTIRSHVAKMIRDRRPEAEKLLRGAGGRGNVGDEVDRMLVEQSKGLTEADRNKHLDKMIEIYKIMGLIPTGEFLDDLHARMVQKAQAEGQSTFGMSKDRTAAGFGRVRNVDLTETGQLTTFETPGEYNNKIKLKEVLADLDEEQFSLNEHTREEILLRQIQLGLYPEVTEDSKKWVLETAKELDSIVATKKANEEAKEAQEKYADEQRRVFEQTEDFFRNKLDILVHDGPKNLWRSLLEDFKRQFIDKASNLLARLFSGQGGAGQGGGFGSIFGGGGGFGGGQGGFGGGGLFGGNQGGGIFNFGGNSGGGGSAPGSASGSAGGIGGSLGGILGGGGKGGILNSLFGPRKNILSGKMSKLGGMMGGIGDIAAMAGGFIPGRAGKAIQYAGMGASIGSMFGPIGSAVGAGIGALFGVFSGKDDAIEKLRSAASSQFGISVKDKGVLKSLKALGEGMFGKGNVGSNATAVVRSEEGQNILRAYAESSGQSGLKIDRLNMGDPNWSGNQFRSQFGGFRAGGGSVRARTSYVVGERGPEMFTPATAGTVTPNGGGNMMAEMMRTMDRVADVLDTFESMPADEVVRRGASGAARQIADSYETELANDSRRSEKLSRLTGAMV